MSIKIVLSSIAAAVVLAASSQSANAWGCVAVASDGAYGYSYNWASEQDAELTALNECDAKSTSGDCSTESCEQDE